jgi:hypothetical protein
MQSIFSFFLIFRKYPAYSQSISPISTIGPDYAAFLQDNRPGILPCSGAGKPFSRTKTARPCKGIRAGYV